MVRRPVFVPDLGKPYVSELSLDFEQFSWESSILAEAAFVLRVCMRRMWLGFLVARSGGIVQE